MGRPETILILSASAGGGHMTAAAALEHALHAQAPGADVEVVDVLALSSALFRRLYAGGYLALVRYAPDAMGWLYELMDVSDRRLQHTVRVWIQNLNKQPIVRYIRRRRPRLIINTHYLPAEIVAQMRRGGQLDCPQVTATTDYDTHRMWVQEPTERYHTATPEGKAYLETWGVAPDRVLVSGIPVRPGFAQPRTPAAARGRCQLDPDRPVVLLLCGGFGVGPVIRLLRELMALSGQAQVVAIAGRNERLRARLAACARAAGRPARVIGFTDEMHVWMRAADLVVSKPGGLTAAEALASGVPLVIMNPIPGQETRNSDYLLEQGAAIKVNSPRVLGHRVSTLLSDPTRLQAMRAAAARVARPRAAEQIVADALGLIHA